MRTASCLALVFVCALMLACGGVATSPEEAARTRPVEGSMAAVTLSRTYTPESMDGKWLEIAGSIGTIDEDEVGVPHVLLGGGKYAIKCTFLTSQNLAPLRVGTKVTVRGRCGGTYKSLIILEDCILLP
jgi:hypothetical protein